MLEVLHTAGYQGELLVGMRVSVPFLMAEATPSHPLRFSSWFCSAPCDTVNRTGETLQQMPFAKGSNALKKQVEAVFSSIT